MPKQIHCIVTEPCFRDGRRYLAGMHYMYTEVEGQERPPYLVPKDEYVDRTDPDGFEGTGLNSKPDQPLDSSGMTTSNETAPEDPPSVTSDETAPSEVAATDSARTLAEENNVDLGQVEGTGADGNITKGDVEKFIASEAI